MLAVQIYVLDFKIFTSSFHGTKLFPFFFFFGVPLWQNSVKIQKRASVVSLSLTCSISVFLLSFYTGGTLPRAFNPFCAIHLFGSMVNYQSYCLGSD